MTREQTVGKRFFGDAWANDPDNPVLENEPRPVSELKNEDGVVSPVLPQESDAVAQSAPEAEENEVLKVLGDESKTNFSGDFVLNGQETGGEFSHVSKTWLDKCIPFNEALHELSKRQADIADLKKPLKDWETGINENDQVVLIYKPTGREFRPTEHCLKQIASMTGGSTWTLRDLDNDKEHPTKDDEIVYQRDRRDAVVLKGMIDLLLFQADRVDQEKVRLFRTWENDNTLRAILSQDYCIVNNGWFLEIYQELIPGAMLSHFRGDADTIYGNVLIPDSLREMEDSAYGGMVCIGNSEIGVRRITSVPSVFRAICMNGCIWDQEIGKGISQVHRKKNGKIDLEALKAKIKKVVEDQIPLIDEGIRRLLVTRELSMGDALPKHVLAAFIKSNAAVTKKMAAGIWKCFRVENDIMSGTVGQNSCFTLLNAITRFAQTQSPEVHFKLDSVAGSLTKMKSSKWNALCKTAEAMDDKDVAKLVGDLS